MAYHSIGYCSYVEIFSKHCPQWVRNNEIYIIVELHFLRRRAPSLVWEMNFFSWIEIVSYDDRKYLYRRSIGAGLGLLLLATCSNKQSYLSRSLRSFMYKKWPTMFSWWHGSFRFTTVIIRQLSNHIFSYYHWYICCILQRNEKLYHTYFHYFLKCFFRMIERFDIFYNNIH